MNIMNRKMFNRNARNKLNAMGGIRTLANGGPTMGTNPLTKFNPNLVNQLFTPSLSFGQISDQYMKGIRGQGPLANKFLTPIGQLDIDAADTRLGKYGRQLANIGLSGLENLRTATGIASAFTDPSGNIIGDFLKQPTESARKRRAQEALDVGIMTTSPEIQKNIEQINILEDQERMQQGQLSPTILEQQKKNAEASEIAEEENLIAGEDPDKKKIIKPDPVKPTISKEQQKILDDQKRMQQGQLGTILPKTKEEIAKVINEGTDKEKQDELKQLMQEFTQNAPQYEGLDKGLAIAKIGFAMAAGQSPDAITNIAKALEGGADMFIKDKKQKDDFNRQVQLSALKYGLQEKSKIASENRLIAKERRGFKDYVVGPGGTTYRGKRYEANETIPVSVGDIRDGNLPDNLFADTTIAALLKEKAAYNKLLADARKNKTIKPTELTKQIENYNSAVSDAIDAESGMALIEGAMITVSEDGVVGLSGVVNDAILKGGAFFGMDLTKNYGSKTEVRNAMKAALQKTIPVTLGRTQSANSISNRDVDFLITAYFGEGALDGGILTFATETPTEMVKRLQRAHEQMQNAQKGAFATIKTTEAFLSPLIQPGTSRSAAGLLSADRTRLSEAGLAPGGEEGFGTYVGGQKVVRQIGATRGDDGVIRLDLSK